MFWLIIGIVGVTAFFAGLILIPVLAGVSDLAEMLAVFAIASILTAFLFFSVWALLAGLDQVLGIGE